MKRSEIENAIIAINADKPFEISEHDDRFEIRLDNYYTERLANELKSRNMNLQGYNLSSTILTVLKKKKKNFTKIRKWAKDNGFEVKDESYGYQDAIKIIVNEKDYFTCEMRKSTIYMSIKGQKGSAGGLYVGLNGHHSFHQTTQDDAIRSMEESFEMIKRVRMMRYGKIWRVI